MQMTDAIKEKRPASRLQPYIDAYWFGDFNMPSLTDHSQLVKPNGYIELIVHLTHDHCYLLNYSSWSKSPIYTLIGLFTSPYEVKFRSNVKAFGVRMNPEAVYNLFGVPATEFSEIHVDAFDVVGKSINQFSREILVCEDFGTMANVADNFFNKLLINTNVDYYYLNHAAQLVRKSQGNLKFEDAVKDLWISRRQLEREFKQKIGLTPKQYSRMIRFNHASRMLSRMSEKGLDIHDITHQFGYTDQSHFIREFKQFVGVSPLNLLRNEDSYLDVFDS